MKTPGKIASRAGNSYSLLRSITTTRVFLLTQKLLSFCSFNFVVEALCLKAIPGNLGQREAGRDGEYEAHCQETLGGQTGLEQDDSGDGTQRSKYESDPGHVKKGLTVAVVNDCM